MAGTLYDEMRELYAENRVGLFTYAWTVTGDASAAEDVVQAAVLRILENGHHPMGLRAYLFRAIRNAGIDWYRRQQRGSFTLSETGTEVDAPDAETTLQIRECVARLAPADRETVVLKVVAGMTFPEIAEVMRSNPNTVASRYRRALTAIRSRLEDA